MGKGVYIMVVYLGGKRVSLGSCQFRTRK